MSRKPGIIMVFDMDGVIGPEKGGVQGEPVKINATVQEILHKAYIYRARRIVDAIFLLTKNPSERYVKEMDLALSRAIGRFVQTGSEFKFFDDVLYDSPSYTARRGYPEYAGEASKDIGDVVHMIDYVNRTFGREISKEYLEERVFFFDDHPEYHPEMVEFLGNNFIKITPPWMPGQDDWTDYLALPEFLAPVAPSSPPPPSPLPYSPRAFAPQVAGSKRGRISRKGKKYRKARKTKGKGQSKK